MGILDSIVEWIATQVMNLLDLITGSVLGALGCDTMLKECISEYKRGKGRLTAGEYPTDPVA